MVALNEQIATVDAPTVVEVTKTVADLQPVTDDEFDRAQKNFQQGKKFLLLNKFDEAVSCFDDACKVWSKKHGELNIECADLYFFYGKALLELARVENTVLGNALNGIPEQDNSVQVNDSRYGNPDEVEEKERETIAEKVIDAMCEGGEVNKEEVMQSDASAPVVVAPVVQNEPAVEQPEQTPAVVAVEEAVVEPKPVVVEEVKPVVENGSDEVAAAVVDVPAVVDAVEVEGEGEDVEDDGEDEEEDEEDDENEDISNLQRAWEMFELAKLVYKNNTNELTSYKKRIAECLLKLGEISIEQELYDQALVDIQESIRLQEEEQLQFRDERLLAETYYQLGLAQQFNNQFKFALDSYQRSINILQLRIDKLKEEWNASETKQPLQDEINELEAILPEILGKLEECNEQDQQTVNLVKEAINKFNGQQQQAGVVANGDAEVKDITSLVKSKRKLSSSEPSEIKKTKLDDNNTSEVVEQQNVEQPIEQQ